MNAKAVKKVRKITKRVMKRDFEEMVFEALGLSFKLRVKLAIKLLMGNRRCSD
jgi:hypothetical protein